MTINTPQEYIELQRLVIAKVKHYLEIARVKLGVTINPPKIEFSIKGTNGGTANAGKNLLRFNPTLLRENPDEYLVSTVPHEVAHLIARAKHRGEKIKSHGKEWTSVMWTFGVSAKRCHSYDVSNVPTQLGRTRNVSVPTTYTTPHGTVQTFGIGKFVEFD